MNVLMRGGSGYIGSKIARCLVEEGNQAICTKRSSSDISRLIMLVRLSGFLHQWMELNLF